MEALLLVCDALGYRLIRAKGFVHLANETRRGYLERTGDRSYHRVWSIIEGEG